MNTATALTEPRDVASEMLGRIVLAFGEMDYQVSLCVLRLVATSTFEIFTPIVEAMVLKEKLDVLEEMVAVRFADTPACLEAFARWYGPLGRLRLRRNRLMHGRWDSNIDALRTARFKSQSMAVCNVA
jgi:hypothetical protein